MKDEEIIKGAVRVDGPLQYYQDATEEDDEAPVVPEPEVMTDAGVDAVPVDEGAPGPTKASLKRRRTDPHYAGGRSSASSASSRRFTDLCGLQSVAGSTGPGASKDQVSRRTAKFKELFGLQSVRVPKSKAAPSVANTAGDDAIAALDANAACEPCYEERQQQHWRCRQPDCGWLPSGP